MDSFSSTNQRKSDRPLLALSGAVFLIYVYFTFLYIALTPYPGIAITSISRGWQVNDSTIPEIEIEEILVQIGELDYETYQNNRFRVPFEGFEPGDTVRNVVTSDGQVIEFQMPEPTAEDRLRRLVATLWFFPFWLTGTAVSLFLRPRDRRWRLLIAFMYLTGLWVVIGPIANWQVGGSHAFAIYLSWILIPVILYLHLLVPSPIISDRLQKLLPVFILVAIALATLELIQVVIPISSANPVLGLAIIVSIAILTYRSLKRTISIADRNSSRLMLAGLALSFGPGILLVVIPQISEIGVPSTLALSVAFISLPFLPISYTYAIYKRQLGPMEFRANRLLGLYSFILIYPTIFIVFLLVGEQWIVASSSRTFFLLLISIIFVLATPPLLARLQNLMNRLAYGTQHSPDDILRVFAQQIPTALNRDALIKPLSNDVLPALLIRQSALCLDKDGALDIVFSERVPWDSIPKHKEQLEFVLENPAAYLSSGEDVSDELSWVRLGIPLVTREENIGIWLFGRRDPDDFYPHHDIDLLQTLANQLAPVIENIRLYEALQEHAESLAEEVASRTDELRAEKDRTQAILDSAGEGIFFTDPAGTILYANEAMAQQSGYISKELQGQSLDLWHTEDGSPEAYREMWTAIYTGSEWGGEMLLRRKDGSDCDVSLIVEPIHSDSGQLSGFVGVQSDISKLKEVDRVKSNIISSVSHELKTPLTTIKTYLMLIRRGRPEKRDGYLNVLDRETERLATIIEDLLDLSKLEAGTIPSQYEPVSVELAVGDVITSCATRAVSKQINIDTKIPASLPSAIADMNQLEQVLTNLVINALNYTPHGGRVMLLAGEGSMEERPAVWVRIKDNGPGISTEDLPHLFDRFYRGEAARSSGAPGTGLGLAICKEIVDRHEGNIEVSSKPGEGASFTVWLPAKENNNDDKRSIEPPNSTQFSASD